MANETAHQQQQVNLPSLVVILVLSGLVIRYLFFSSPSSSSSSARAGGGRGSSSSRAAAAADPAALMRSREAAVERIQQMFPQVDRRTVLWDLQRTGGSIQATTERILAGRLETPPVSFQPPPPPPGSNNNNNNNGPAGAQSSKPAQAPAYPDLITRYNLQDKLKEPSEPQEQQAVGSGKGWSSNREERQTLLQRRRDQMILEARRKMEAKIAAEKAAAGTS